MIWIFRFLLGFVKVEFSGDTPEKILNIAALNRIFLWDSHLTKKGIESCISIKDFKKLRFAIRKSGVRVHILEKYGLPFKTLKNRKRLGLIVGLAIFLIFLKFMSSYIWIIDITGNKKVDKKQILSALHDIGITEGVKSSEIDPKIQREKLLLKIDSLAWASLNIEGSKLTVNVSEIKNKKPNKNAPSNLKASADGIIKKIDVNSGNCLVKKGDTVKKGDVLVSGIIEHQRGTEFVRSLGTITAITRKSFSASGDFNEIITEETGLIKNKYVLQVFGIKIPLFLGSENEKYNSTLKTHNLTISGAKLPIKIHSKEFRFLNEYKRNFKYNELCLKLEKEIAKSISENKIKNYTLVDKKINQTKNGIEITSLIETEENIAVNEDLILSEKPE